MATQSTEDIRKDAEAAQRAEAELAAIEIFTQTIPSYGIDFRVEVKKTDNPAKPWSAVAIPLTEVGMCHVELTKRLIGRQLKGLEVITDASYIENNEEDDDNANKDKGGGLPPALNNQ